MRSVLRSRTAPVPPASLWALLDTQADGPAVGSLTPGRPRADVRVVQAAPHRHVMCVGTIARVPIQLSVDLRSAPEGRTEVEVRLRPHGATGLLARPLLTWWAGAFLRGLVRAAADEPWSAGIEPDELAG